MKRLIGALVLAILAAPLAVEAQATRLPRIGALVVVPPVIPESFHDEFRAGLRELGYVEGQNILVDYRGEDRVDRLPELARELLRPKVDIVVASTTPAVEAAKRATSEIPIVMLAAGEPVGTGLVASLAQPPPLAAFR